MGKENQDPDAVRRELMSLTPEGKEVLKATADFAAADALAYMQSYFHHENRDIPIPAGYIVPDEIVEARLEQVNNSVDGGMSDAERRIYSLNFRIQCKLGYPPTIS